MRENGIAPANGPESTSFQWMMDVFAGDTFVNSYGRVFDITVIGRPASGGSRMSTLEAALFGTGGPILIAPPAPPTVVGEKVLVAWNGSAETARTIAFAKPVLSRASHTIVLSVQGGAVSEPNGEQMATYLRRNGVAAEAISVPAGSRTVGQTILDQAASLSADLLIKGAYTQSRLSQMFFGGATRHIITETRLPVFMAH